MRFCLLLLLPSLFQLALAGPPPPGAVVRGRLLHPTASVVQLQRRDWLTERTRVVTVRLSAQGTFAAVLDSLDGPTAVQLIHGRQYAELWLLPGDTLELQADARRFDNSLQFSGLAADPNYYRLTQLRQRTADFYLAPEGRRTPGSPEQLRARADAFRSRAEAVLAEAVQRYHLPPAFCRQEAAAIGYEWGRVLLGAATDYEYRRPMQGAVVRRLPDAYYDFTAALPFPADSSLPSLSYRLYGDMLGFHLLRARRQRMVFADFIPRQFAWSYDTLRQVLPAGPSQDWLLARQLSRLLAHGRSEELAPRLTDFRRQYPASPWLAPLTRQAAQYQRTAPGQPLPAFQLIDARGRSVSLDTLRGRLVYLDVWASWCQPCRAEAPALLALRRRFASRPEVLFVGVSIDARAPAWQRALLADGLGSGPNQAQFRAQPTDEALRRLYGQQGVPFYWLIGPDGRILNDHAPRPSSSEAAAAIEAALAARP
ncbi:TlpA family protein disulfide reductase [Hymenobacter sp. 15J16-1T3B]|uniref:TlpA family protein disulfide reductase n=1 Tax=Hymenobacter sp. 15J16-1T3B TaxID=2886941 RepID=UPI001D110527|nr:TlpA disulfide reductase family protein [Hymenobacter sp. 15J16-1T3B]MCC3160640.1 TlpA family protein disulfide reductase [Hymenobacter sp. 15J16-1T3B]